MGKKYLSILFFLFFLAFSIGISNNNMYDYYIKECKPFTIDFNNNSFHGISHSSWYIIKINSTKKPINIEDLSVFLYVQTKDRVMGDIEELFITNLTTTYLTTGSMSYVTKKGNFYFHIDFDPWNFTCYRLSETTGGGGMEFCRHNITLSPGTWYIISIIGLFNKNGTVEPEERNIELQLNFSGDIDMKNISISSGNKTIIYFYPAFKGKINILCEDWIYLLLGGKINFEISNNLIGHLWAGWGGGIDTVKWEFPNKTVKKGIAIHIDHMTPFADRVFYIIPDGWLPIYGAAGKWSLTLNSLHYRKFDNIIISPIFIGADVKLP